MTINLSTSMAARQGPLAMVAHQICLQVWLSVSLLADTQGSSGQALIASSLAKGNYNIVREITYFALKMAMSGYVEALTWILCSYKENFSLLNRKDDKSIAVVIANPRSADFEVALSSLMPGILKTVGHNKDHPNPIKIFEVGAVSLLDESKEVGERNCCQLAALYCGAKSGFESVFARGKSTMQYHNSKIKFPLVFKNVRPPARKLKITYF